MEGWWAVLLARWCQVHILWCISCVHETMICACVIGNWFALESMRVSTLIVFLDLCLLIWNHMRFIYVESLQHCHFSPSTPQGWTERERGRGRRERFILVTFLRFHSKCVHLNLYRKLCLSTCPPCCRIRWEIGQWLTRSCSTHARPACKETRRPRMKTKYRAKTQHDHLEHWQSRYMTHPDFAQESPSVPADLRGSRWGSPLCVGKIVCVCVCLPATATVDAFCASSNLVQLQPWVLEEGRISVLLHLEQIWTNTVLSPTVLYECQRLCQENWIFPSFPWHQPVLCAISGKVLVKAKICPCQCPPPHQMTRMPEIRGVIQQAKSRVRCILAFKLRWCWIPARWHVWIICVALLLITARAISEKTWKDDITKEKEVWIHKPSSPLNTSC